MLIFLSCKEIHICEKLKEKKNIFKEEQKNATQKMQRCKNKKYSSAQFIQRLVQDLPESINENKNQQERFFFETTLDLRQHRPSTKF